MSRRTVTRCAAAGDSHKEQKGGVNVGTLADRRYFLLLLGGLSALAWLTLWLWGQSPYGRFLHHDVSQTADLSAGVVMLIAIVGWVVMVIAMMLPTSLPLVALFHRLTRQRPEQMSLIGLLLAGYLSVWTLFGVVVHLSDRLLHEVVEQSPVLGAQAWIIGAGILVLAGTYQFMPLKYACLEKCRAPLGFITAYWQGSHARRQAFRLGLHHGLFCVGCCWSLMLLMFVVGIGNLGWMFVLGALMALEKNLPWGRWLSAPLGVILLGWGITLGVQAVWALP
jgi:predicted metal-binding membrane protein